MPEYTHERFGKCVLAEITQKQLVDYSKQMQDKKDLTLIEWRGESVKAAIKCGFFIEPMMTDKEVDDSKPAFIRWMSDKCIAEMIAEATNIDPLS
jgi:hypothetical protein